MNEYEDLRFCPNCDDETLQLCIDSTHERDSSQDRRECTRCGWVYSGYTGEYEAP